MNTKRNILMAIAAALISAKTMAAEPQKLHIVPCDVCAVSEDVIKAIELGYAKALGSTPTGGELEVRISEIIQREAGARIMFGAMAGKDRISATFILTGETQVVEDTARSAVCGIECVGKNIGQQIAEKVAPEKVEATRKSENEYQM